jgi:hypothetical protein
MLTYLESSVLIAVVLCSTLHQDLSAASLAKRSETALSYDLANKLVPTWTGGALLVVEGENTAQPQLRAFDNEGRLTTSVVLRVTGATLVTVAGVARGTDASIAACGDAVDSEGRGAPYLAIFSANGANLRVIRTTPYHPFKVTVASDGTIWTMGHESAVRQAGGPKPHPPLRPEAGVIRRFDPTGQEIGSFVLQSNIPSPSDLLDLGNYLGASAKSVAWYCVPENRYVEISLDGQMSSDIHVKPTGVAQVTGFAITDAGGVFISTVTQGPKRWNIERLGGDRQEWATVGGGDGWGILYGAHGTTLVGSTSGTRRNTLEFFEAVD